MTDRIDALLDRMTLDEQAALLAGADFWTTVAIDRLGIPAVKVTDGPNGARGAGGLTDGVPATCFPAAVSLGASWDVEAAAELGRALAAEARSKGARVLLAPTVNLHRSGLNGRNFECFSEDPHLTSALAVSYVAALQAEGIAATVKHFAANDSEVERQTMSSDVDERTLRELYLAPFEAVVKQAGVMAVMSGYNRLNGTWCSEHPWLLTDVLRGDWGFDGIVMSDWFGTHSTEATVNAGLDLEMPGPERHRGAKIVTAVAEGRIAAGTVRASARRILTLIERVGAFDDPAIPAEQAIERPEHRALVRRLGAGGAVLLKNAGLLPLDGPALSRIAVIGPNAATARIMGGGSAQMNAHRRVSPLDGLTAALPGVAILTATGAGNDRLVRPVTEGIEVDYFRGTAWEGAPVATRKALVSDLIWFDLPHPDLTYDTFSARFRVDLVAEDAGEYLFGLTCAGLARMFVDGELLIDADTGWTRGENFFGLGNTEQRATLELAAGQRVRVTVDYRPPVHGTEGIDIRAIRFGIERPLGEAAIRAAVEAAAAAEVAILCVGRNGEWDTEGLDLPHMRLPGRQDELIARVAGANPNTVVVLQTGGPVEMPWLDQVGAVVQFWYPGQEAGHAIADVLLGHAAPGGRLPQTFPAALRDMPCIGNDPGTYPGRDGHVRYAEGLNMGYRHFDRADVAPAFPFGFGLGYTRFDWGAPRTDSPVFDGETLEVTLEVTNAGDRAGVEVVQLYVEPVAPKVDRPLKELRAFARLELAPGETGTARLTLSRRAFAWYDVDSASFRADAGSYALVLASDAATERSRLTVTLPEDWIERPEAAPEATARVPAPV